MNNRKISACPIAILKFYQKNTEIIKIKQEEFKEWLKTHYLADSGNGRFIPTKEAVENGYMINDKQLIVTYNKEKEDFDFFVSYSAFITPEGQNYVLDCFEGKIDYE